MRDRVYVYPADIQGCGKYRAIWPATWLEREGRPVSLVLPGSGRARVRIREEVGDDGVARVVEHTFPRDASVAVFQRISMPDQLRILRAMRDAGIAIVIDFDDDLSRIHPRNQSFGYFHPKSTSQASWHLSIQAAEMADWVTVSTPALVDVYGRHGRCSVIRNYVPGYYLSTPHEDSALLGWGGHTGSHPDDLPVMGSSVQRLVAEGHRFMVVGPPSEVRDQLRLADDPEYSGPVDIDHWVDGLSRLGVGIAPLAETLFNRSKSRLKVLEYSAAGVAWVASDLPEYRATHADAGGGVGFLAARPRDWYRLIKRLLTDRGLRVEQSAAGREYAATQTIELHAYRWWQAWQQARDHRARRG